MTWDAVLFDLFDTLVRFDRSRLPEVHLKGRVVRSTAGQLHDTLQQFCPAIGLEDFGYAVLRMLAERGMEIDQGTLYPLLRRLGAQGLLQSSWDVGAGRPRRYYVISTAGRKLFTRLKTEYDGMVAAMGGMLK